MVRIRLTLPFVIVALAGISQAWSAEGAPKQARAVPDKEREAAGRAAEPLRQQVLQLNKITGSEVVSARAKELVADKEGTKKLIAAALEMIQDKDAKKSPLTYNAAYVLAQAGAELKDFKASETLFRVCIDQGIRLQSTRKLRQSYSGMFDLFDRNKLTSERDRICQELLDLKTDDGKPRIVFRAFTTQLGETDFDESEGFDSAQPLRISVLRLLIESTTNQKKFDQALTLADSLIKAKDSWDSLVLRAWVLEAGKYGEAVKVYQDILKRLPKDGQLSAEERDAAEESVRRALLEAITRQGKFDEALAVVDKLINAKDDWRQRMLRGWVLEEAGRFEDAIKAYEDVLERVGKDRKLSAEKRRVAQDRFRRILSNLHVEMKQIDQAAEMLQALLKEKPDDPGLHNDLGYIWADNNSNLEEAEKLIRKALDLDRERRQKAKVDAEENRDNGAYLDSLGWVLFKQNKLKEAKEQLQKAVEDKDAQHIEIYDHLGDVLWALNERDAALEAWRKGLDSAGTSRREQARKAEVEKKVEKHSAAK